MQNVSRNGWLLILAVVLLLVPPPIAAQRDIRPPALVMAQLAFDAPVVQAHWADEDVLWIGVQSGLIVAWNLATDEQSVVWTGRGWIGGFIPVENGFITWRNSPLNCTDFCTSDIELADGTSFLHPARILTAELHPDDSQLLTTASDGGVRLYSIPTGELIAETLIVGVNGATLNADGTQLLAWDRAGVVRQFAVDDLSVPNQTFVSNGWMSRAAFIDDAVLTIETNGVLTLWGADGAVAAQATSRATLYGGALTTERDFLLVFGQLRRGVFEVWRGDLSSQLLAVPTAARVRGAVFNPTHTQIAVWDDDQQVQVWLLPNPDECYITTGFSAVNQRTAPSVEAAIDGQLGRNEVRLAIGLAQADDGFIWYQLQDETWVRDDVIEASGACASLPIIDP